MDSGQSYKLFTLCLQPHALVMSLICGCQRENAMKISTLATLSTVLSMVLFLAEPNQGDDGSGETRFRELCVGCHGPDGRAQTETGKKVGAVDLTSDAVQQKDDSQLSKIVKDGKGKMPAFGDQLSGDDTQAVIVYVRQLAKKQ